jgi:hypothetical protein
MELLCCVESYAFAPSEQFVGQGLITGKVSVQKRSGQRQMAWRCSTGMC